MKKTINLQANSFVSEVTKDDLSLNINICSADESIYLRVEGEYILTNQENHFLEINILNNIEVLDINISSMSPLIIKFNKNISLIVPWSEDYESWEINTSSGLKIISLPGGELAIWETKEH